MDRTPGMATTVERDVTETLRWVARARQLVPEPDRRVLLSPARLVSRFVRFAMLRGLGGADDIEVDDPEARDPQLIDLVIDLLRIAARGYFRLRVEGVDHVPAEGPVLLVGNHNGGLVPTDGFFTALAICDRHGSRRAVYALAHDFLFDDPLLRWYARRLGILRARHESAMRAFDTGGCVLVYPGSDLDTYRPFRERGRVILGGRKGFLRLALRARVPIVPVVSAGTHEQYIVLTRGDWLARVLRAHVWARTDVLPFVLALPWGLTSGFVPYWPLPAQTTLEFGAPIRWPDLAPEDADRPEALDHCYHEVETRMQAMLDRLSRGRHFLVGKPN